MRASHWYLVAVLALAIFIFARYWLQRQESGALRAELAWLQRDKLQLEELRAENERLRAARISDSELERLRNDRAALVGLRAEINKLEESADRKARTMRELKAEPLPALVLNFAMKDDGSLSLDGSPAGENALRELFSKFAQKSERVDIRFRINTSQPHLDLMKKNIDDIVRLGKELGLRYTIKFEKPTTEAVSR